MIGSMKKLGKILAIIITVLFVAYAVFISFPHGHVCLALDCAVCNAMDFLREILIGVALLAVCQMILGSLFICSLRYEHIVLSRVGTPVDLRVKLSN